MYAGPIVDAHTHLWDLAMNKHPWLRADGAVRALGGLEALRQTYLVDDYLRDSAGQGIVASVHIEALWDRADTFGETRWLETLDKSRGVAVRYIAAAPLGTPEGLSVLEAQAAVARVVGVRDVLSFHPTQPEKSFAARSDITADPAWRRDVAQLAQLGLTLELMMYPYQLAGVLDVARSLPNLTIVVNHCASPIDRDDPGMERWRAAVRLLAREPNILLKVSNAVAYDPHPTLESVRVVAMHCIECFGPARTMLATDWPVARLNIGFGEIYQMFRMITADLTEPEQRALFHDTATRVYRL